MQRIITFVLILLYISFVSYSNPPIRKKLNDLEKKVNKLEYILQINKNKKTVFIKELSHTEKQISENIFLLRKISKDIDTTQNKIETLQSEIQKLNQRLRRQQKLLSKNITARYKMGPYQPFKWLLNKDTIHQMNCIFSFYKYIIYSRKNLIKNIDTIKNDLSINKNKLTKELSDKETLQKHLEKNQKQLEQNKQYHIILIQSLYKKINSTQNTLKEYKENQKHLLHVLHTLIDNKQSVVHPFSFQTWPRPVKVSQKYWKILHHGIEFFASEGTLVTAVQSGKIVFSDWLKGYGLIVIIDHGNNIMTLYAHNQSLFKRIGDTVSQGEAIATIGHSGGLKQNGLYFEIRHRGKAIPPQKWLS